MKIAVTGSLAYDYIMSFPGHFKDHILQDKAHILTVSFLVESMKRMRGGVAGNVAYSLALLGAKPSVVATAGSDFADYRGWMEQHGVDTSGIATVEGDATASCFINTDRSNNQIVAFYAGAMSHAHLLDLERLKLTREDLIIISPTDPGSMERAHREALRLGVPYLFDPGKQTPRLSTDFLWAGIQGASVLIGNDYEFAMMAKATGRPEAELIRAAPTTVVTQGEQGATLYQAGREVGKLPVAKVSTVADPTGCGDGFLAGLVFGLSAKLPLPVTGRIATLTAAYVVEKKGCQEHHFTRPEFLARYQATYGSTAELKGALDPGWAA